MTRPYTHWTTSELKRFRECYPVTSREELIVMFAPHSMHSIAALASSLKLRKQKRIRPKAVSRWKAICAQHQPVIFGVRI